MLRKQALITSAFATHVAKLIRYNMFTVEQCRSVPFHILHLSVEKVKDESDEKLINLLNTIYMCNPGAIAALSYFRNSVLRRLSKLKSVQTQ